MQFPRRASRLVSMINQFESPITRDRARSGGAGKPIGELHAGSCFEAISASLIGVETAKYLRARPEGAFLNGQFPGDVHKGRDKQPSGLI